MKLILKLIFYIIVFFLDTTIWLIINLVKSKIIILILKRRPWRKFSYKANSKLSKRFSYLINKFILIRCDQKPLLSSCLSRSITARLLLDLFNIQNDLYLGMTKNSKGNKIPHAWVKQKNNGFFVTPGIYEHEKGVVLMKI